MSEQNYQNYMVGDANGATGTLRAGFIPGNPSIAMNGAMGNMDNPNLVPVSRAELAESLDITEKKLRDVADKEVRRVEITGDLSQLQEQLNLTMEGVRRALTSSNVPVRQNLEAPAVAMVPLDTPFRNMIPRTRGASTASIWKQLTTLGGGWGEPGGVLQPGGGDNPTRMFYTELGAPANFDEDYLEKVASYKLLGAFGSITEFAMAAGATYQDQLSRKRVHTLQNLMLNEEYALIAGDAASTSAPWGDGTNALAFNGIYNLTTTANGTPTNNIQSAVGALTREHIDGQLINIWQYGGRNLWMLMAAQEIQSLVNLAGADGSIIRVQAAAAGDVILGMHVTGWVHPVTSEVTSIVPSRFASNGTILFGAKEGPVNPGEGDTNTFDVNVLPQVPTPAASPESPQEIQGYVVTELARSQTAPDVVPIMVSVYETPRMKNANVFAKSTGVTSAYDVAPSGSGSGA